MKRLVSFPIKFKFLGFDGVFHTVGGRLKAAFQPANPYEEIVFMRRACFPVAFLLSGIIAGAILSQAVWLGGVGWPSALTVPTYSASSLGSVSLGFVKETEFTFTVIPLEDDAYYEIIPLGNLGPPGHTFPSDHIYFVLNDGVYNVRAPADGVIIEIENCTEEGASYQDYSLFIKHTDTFKSYFYHLSGVADWIISQTGEIEVGWGGVEVNIPVKAGDIVGVASKQPGGSVCLDWGAIDYEVTLSFIHPETYYPDAAHAVCPLDYLEGSLKEKAYSKVNRVGEPKGGKIDYDMLGRLSGNWFLEGAEPCIWNWSTQLAFVYYVHNASQMVVSVGGDLLSPLPVGVFNATGPDFREVSAEDGVVTYYLVGQEPSELKGQQYTLIVQVIGSEKIKVEAFEGHQERLTFTEKAKTYTRTGPYGPTCDQGPMLGQPALSALATLYYVQYYSSHQQAVTLYVAACGVAAAAAAATFIIPKRMR
nr:hypothetical protein [Candidatus Freyrarchaeum guaymaensis]